MKICYCHGFIRIMANYFARLLCMLYCIIVNVIFHMTTIFYNCCYCHILYHKYIVLGPCITVALQFK